MPSLPPVRKRKSYSDLTPDDLVSALFYDRIANDSDPDVTPPPVQVHPDSVKALAPLTPEEQRLADLLAPIFQRYGVAAVNAVMDGTALDTAELSDALRATILAEVTQAALDAMILSADEVGLAVDAAQAATTASTWARGATYNLVQGLDETTRAALQSAVATFLETPGMTREQVTSLLAPTFGARRAETIAVTEITRAAAEGAKLTQAELRKAGLEYTRIWRTANDERTCPVCAPLNGKAESEWGGLTPPAHPNCRCSATLRRNHEG